MANFKGIHHVAMKCRDMEEYEKAIKFYNEVIGLPIKRSWPAGTTLDAGNCYVEIFNNGKDDDNRGVIQHFAFQVEDLAAAVKLVTDAGYTIKVGPKDVTLAAETPYPISVAFFDGPIGEEIELFMER